MALQPWHHAAVYAIERVLAEYDGVGAADPQTARLGGPAPTNGRRNHQLAGSDSPGLEPEPDGLCVGWEASLAAGASASTRARCGRVGSMCASTGAPAHLTLVRAQPSTCRPSA